MACIQAGISQAELARRLETTPQNLSARIRHGRFSGEELNRISAALGAQVEIVFRFGDITI